MRLLVVPILRRASRMMLSSMRMMLLYLPMSSSTSVFVVMRPPAASVSMSSSSRRSRPCCLSAAIRPVSICFLSTMQNTGGSGGFSSGFARRCAAGFAGFVVMWSRWFCPGWRIERTMVCLFGCVILSMRPPTRARLSSLTSACMEKPSRLMLDSSFFVDSFGDSCKGLRGRKKPLHESEARNLSDSCRKV